MSRRTNSSVNHVARIVRSCLRRGGTVEIDGLGVFRPDAAGGYQFVRQTRPRVFLAYVKEDEAAAQKLFDQLAASGFDPWLDSRKLLPGQNWPRAIEGAIETSDFFLACFSRCATQKRGQFQCELRFALECAARLPLGDTYFIPLRLERCSLPRRITREIQYLDLFPDWDAGVRTAVAAMREQQRSGGLRPAV